MQNRWIASFIMVLIFAVAHTGQSSVFTVPLTTVPLTAAEAEEVARSDKGITCNTLIEELQQYQESVAIADEGVVNYFRDLTVMLESLYKQHLPQEGNSVDFPKGAFDPVHHSATRAALRAEQVFQSKEVYDSFLLTTSDVLKSCLARNDAPDKQPMVDGQELEEDPEKTEDGLLVARLERYNTEVRENESVTGEFIFVFADEMDKWHSAWGPWEDSTQVVPEGEFGPINDFRNRAENTVPLLEDLSITFNSELAEIIDAIMNQSELQESLPSM